MLAFDTDVPKSIKFHLDFYKTIDQMIILKQSLERVLKNIDILLHQNISQDLFSRELIPSLLELEERKKHSYLVILKEGEKLKKEIENSFTDQRLLNFKFMKDK